jgi:Protein of unknown function (DUF2569)
MRIKSVIIESVYVFICLILGSIWFLGGLYEIIAPLFKIGSNIKNLHINFLAIILGYFLIKYWFNRNKKKIDKRKNKTSTYVLGMISCNKGKKIGGWLVLVCVGLFVNLGNCLNNIDLYETDIFKIENVNALSTSEYGLEVLSSLRFGYYITSFAVPCFVVLLILFFQYKKTFTKTFIFVYLSIIVFHAIDYLIAISLNTSIFYNWKINNVENNIILSVGSALIWIPYLLKSERVKKTFVK